MGGLFTGLSSCGAGTSPVPYVLVGLLTADSHGAPQPLQTTGTVGGHPRLSVGLPWTYSVEGNGRATIVTGTNVALAYW